MIVRRSQILALLGLLTMAGCQPAPPAGLSDADRAAVKELSTQFVQAFLAGDMTAVGQTYAENATLLPPNAPGVTGREAITAFMATFPPVTEFTTTDDVIEGFGNLAYVSGRYRMTLAVGGGVVDSGKYLDIRQRQADGSWRYLVDMFSSSIPLPAPPTP
ncbi:MAG: nuclear transport factor 2 family protein [Gemmatimonadota bacterium]